MIKSKNITLFKTLKINIYRERILLTLPANQRDNLSLGIKEIRRLMKKNNFLFDNQVTIWPSSK